MDRIIPHLWYDREAFEAAQRYTQILCDFRVTGDSGDMPDQPNGNPANPQSGTRTGLTADTLGDSRIISRLSLENTPSGTAEVVTIRLAGQPFQLLSAGPGFAFTPAISFRIDCASKEETAFVWGRLAEGGQPLMPFGSYPFSAWYGWTEDRYGLSWQVMYTPDRPVTQKVTPTLMFSGSQHGRAEEAIRFYTGVFPDSEISFIDRYHAGEEPDVADTIRFAAFRLGGMAFAAMDSARVADAPFTEAISLLVPCESQAEIDFFWEQLSAVPEAEQCGWLKDRFGVSWQIVPAGLDRLLATPDSEQKRRVTEAFLAMKKLDVAALEKAFRGD